MLGVPETCLRLTLLSVTCDPFSGSDTSPQCFVTTMFTGKKQLEVPGDAVTGYLDKYLRQCFARDVVVVVCTKSDEMFMVMYNIYYVYNARRCWRRALSVLVFVSVGNHFISWHGIPPHQLRRGKGSPLNTL